MHAKHVMENRKNIIPITETIILCGQQNIAILHICVSDKFTLDNTEKIENDGDFRKSSRFFYKS